MTVKDLIKKLEKMPPDYVVGCEEQDDLGVCFKEYKHVSKAQDYDGKLVFIY